MRSRWLVVLVAAAVVVVVVAANALAYSTRAQVDLSANSRFTLAKESREVARAVDEGMRITAFLYESGGTARDARFLLSRYRELNPRIEYRVVDPDERPSEARRYGVTGYSTVVFEYQGRQVEAAAVDELGISSGILRVLRGETKTLCFLTGHGEAALDDDSAEGFSQFAAMLERNAYRGAPLDLARERTVPDECAAVVVAGPTVSLLPRETSVLREWTNRAGRLLVLATPFAGPEADVNPLLERWAIQFVGGLAVDPARTEGIDLSNLIVEEFPTANPIVESVPRLQFPAPGGLLVGDPGREGLTVSRLAVTSDSGFVELTPDVAIEFEPGDVPGPVVLAAAADDSRVEAAGEERVEGGGARIVRTRVVAVGGSEWATNRFLDLLGNRRFLLNTLGWLTQEEELLAVTAPVSTVRPLPWTPERSRRAIAVTVVGVPALVVAFGIVLRVLARRRERRLTA